MSESPEISGLLYKKRGGFAASFGKIVPNIWQFRFFTIINGVLSYYDTDMPDVNFADNRPRGRIDLKTKKVEMFTNSALEGAPNNYTIVLIPQNEEKWKLCAASKEDQFRWIHVLEKYVESVVTVPSGGHYSRASILYHLDDENGPPNSTPQVTIIESNNVAPRRLSHDHSVIVHEKKSGKKRLKSGGKAEIISSDTLEHIMATLSFNACIAMIILTKINLMRLVYIIIANFVVGYTIYLRGKRCVAQAQLAADLSDKLLDEEQVPQNANPNQPVKSSVVDASSTSNQSSSANVSPVKSGKPIAGATFKEVTTPQLQPPNHTWFKCDYRAFNVRVGPNYGRYKKKAPSAAPLYDIFAVDVFCTKNRMDNVAEKFQLPDSSHIKTNHPFVPPYFVIQLQIPSDPPPSLFTTVEDGPGWAIVFYFKITEETCEQLKNFDTASPAVKLFAEYCQKAPEDPAMRARFKVICSCSNMEELGVPQFISSYNAKPVLIRRTGTLFRGKNYIEKDIHIFKFANLAKQSIHYLSSRCGLMYMQIGFVIEGRTDAELPETLLGCVGANKPQEDLAEFIFYD